MKNLGKSGYYLCLLLLVILYSACRHERKVNTSFYYWKTIYRHNPTEDAFLNHFHPQALYIRVTDVDLDDAAQPAPVSPIVFKDRLPANVGIVPVVFVVNDILRAMAKPDLDKLAAHIVAFATAKVQQAGRSNFKELQIDCDWTTQTRDNYFYLLQKIRAQPQMQGKQLSVTLRLHQLKDQKGSGIPPANRVMLMCYNMGNLRKFGRQNSIIDLDELKKYLGDNLKHYPLPADIGLPLFSWAVAFRDKQYIGLSKRIGRDTLLNKREFTSLGGNLYTAVTDLPQFGLLRNDVVRWEISSQTELESTSKYLSRNLDDNAVDIIYFHLDETLLRSSSYASLETVSNLFR